MSSYSWSRFCTASVSPVLRSFRHLVPTLLISIRRAVSAFLVHAFQLLGLSSNGSAASIFSFAFSHNRRRSSPFIYPFAIAVFAIRMTCTHFLIELAESTSSPDHPSGQLLFCVGILLWCSSSHCTRVDSISDNNLSNGRCCCEVVFTMFSAYCTVGGCTSPADF